MAIACPTGLNTAVLRAEISGIYGRVADEPGGDFHFHRGPVYAAEFLGYDASELAALPPGCTASFAGVGNPFAIGPIHTGEVVLDIGCGAGMDLLLSAKRAGASGCSIGVDMTDAMLERARKSAADAGLGQVEVRRGDATALPVADGDVDVVTSNGVLNLVPEKQQTRCGTGSDLPRNGRRHGFRILVDAGRPADVDRPSIGASRAR